MAYRNRIPVTFECSAGHAGVTSRRPPTPGCIVRALVGDGIARSAFRAPVLLAANSRNTIAVRTRELRLVNCDNDHGN